MVNNNNDDSQEEQQSEIIRINPAMKRYFELEIERDTLQNAPRDEAKLREELLKLKEKEKEQKKQLTC